MQFDLTPLASTAVDSVFNTLPVFECILELLLSKRLFPVDKLVKKANSTRHFSFVLFAQNSSNMSLHRVTSST